MQIQQTAAQSQRALNASLQQSSAKDRERRILQLTIDEISQMKGDVKLYKGVGKMSVICLCEPPQLWSYQCPWQVYACSPDYHGRRIKRPRKRPIR